MSDDDTITRSSGNVFADAGLPDADHQLVRAQLVSRIDDIIRARGLSQREAARILDVAQPDLSNLLRGRFRGYSIERLMRMLTAFDCDVSILVTEKGREPEHPRPLARRSIEVESRAAGFEMTMVEPGRPLLEGDVVDDEEFRLPNTRSVGSAREELKVVSIIAKIPADPHDVDDDAASSRRDHRGRKRQKKGVRTCQRPFFAGCPGSGSQHRSLRRSRIGDRRSRRAARVLDRRRDRCRCWAWPV